MDNINDLLNSISDEDMAKLKSVATSLMGGNSQGPQKAEESISSSLFSDDTTKLIMQVATQMNKDSDKTAFIKALRPLLSEQRRSKADEAMRFLKLMDTLPLLRGMFR